MCIEILANEKLLEFADYPIDADSLTRMLVLYSARDLFGKLRIPINGSGVPKRLLLNSRMFLDLETVRKIGKIYDLDMQQHMRKELAHAVLVEVRRAFKDTGLFELIDYAKIDVYPAHDERIYFRYLSNNP